MLLKRDPEPAGGRNGGSAAASAPAPAPPPDVWFYKDPSGNEQGPFAAPKLLKWVEQGYFSSDLPVSLHHLSFRSQAIIRCLSTAALWQPDMGKQRSMGKQRRAWLKQFPQPSSRPFLAPEH